MICRSRGEIWKYIDYYIRQREGLCWIEEHLQDGRKERLQHHSASMNSGSITSLIKMFISMSLNL
nr:MAG TPA: hypothetical protein [Caudoviricetes sp.]